jgi:hypothetical protein
MYKFGFLVNVKGEALFLCLIKRHIIERTGNWCIALLDGATCVARLLLPWYFLVGGWEDPGSGLEVTEKNLISASAENRSHTVQLVASDHNERPFLVTFSESSQVPCLRAEMVASDSCCIPWRRGKFSPSLTRQRCSAGIIIFYSFIILSGVRLSPLGTAAITGLLYQL